VLFGTLVSAYPAPRPCRSARRFRWQQGYDEAIEAGAVASIEEADASQGEVRTKQVLEDDVSREYLENDPDRRNQLKRWRRSPLRA
jgi:hypothetical protein